MGLFGKNRKKRGSYSDELALVFDIGSSSVGGALVVLDRENVPRVLYATRYSMVFQQELDFERFVSSMLETFSTVAVDLQQKGMEYVNEYRQGDDMAINRALCIYSSPWYTAQTKVLKRTEDKAFTVNQKLIDDLVAREQEQFKGGNASGDKVEHDGHIIEQKVTGILLNGYSTHDIVDGRTALELSVTMSMTMIASDIVNAIEERLQKVFTVELIDHHSFGMAGFTVLRNMFPEVHDFMFIDVSGEVTDVTFGKDDALLDTVSFPIGKNYIVRQLTGDFNADHHSIESLLQSRDHASTDVNKVLDTSLKSIDNQWRSGLRNAISHVEHEVSPEVVFYIADSSIVSIVGEFVEAEFARVHEVQGVTLKDVIHFNDPESRDTFIGINTVYCNTLFKLS